jgi:hypothetical protein
MSTENGNHGTPGVIHIECRKHGGEPSEYLVSFGGDTAGVFYLGKASGFTRPCAADRPFKCSWQNRATKSRT